MNERLSACNSHVTQQVISDAKGKEWEPFYNCKTTESFEKRQTHKHTYWQAIEK